jgi:hypothetical protein
MKKTFTFLLAILMATTVSAQNILLGGNMESATDWTVTNLNGGAPNPVLTWNETTYTPSMGEGGCLRVTSPGGASPSSTVAIYQAVTLEAGKLYTFNGAFIDNAGGLLEAGIQVYLGATEPGTADYSDGWLCEYNSWVPGYEPADRDDTFETGATGSRKLLCTTSGTYYLVVKVGLWNTHNMDISLDELTLTVSDVTTLTGGGMLSNGDMEAQGAWIENTLNSASPVPSATWGFTGNTPQYGQAGCLRVVGLAPASNFTQYSVYQKLSLEAGKTYEYDIAFKDNTPDCIESWVEIYLGASEPVAGVDYQDGGLGYLNSWTGYTPGGKDITFQSAAGGVKNFICDVTQDYYFVIKMGSMKAFDFVLDEVYFREKGTNTAIKEIKAANHKIRTVNSTIVVDGVTSKVELFDLSGRCLQSQKMSGTFSSKILNTGLYIVRVDGFTSKIVVR